MHCSHISPGGPMDGCPPRLQHGTTRSVPRRVLRAVGAAARLACAVAVLLACVACQHGQLRLDDVGKAAVSTVNQSPELRREIAYAVVDAYKDAAIARFATYRQVAGHNPPTFYRLTSCDPIQRQGSGSIAVIGATVRGDGYQNRTFRGRVDFAFAVAVTTPIDFVVDWDGKRAVIALNPQFTKVDIKHDYTPFEKLNDLMVKGTEAKTQAELQQSFGGPQRWIVEKVNGKWAPRRDPGLK